MCAPYPSIRIEGDLDHETAPHLPALVERVVRAVDPGLVVLDLAGVRFINSAGIRALVLARAAAADLLLRCPSPLVRRVLTATGDDRLFAIEPGGAA
ncbi:STAS domain-containing protein [Cryptosporangium phraense]|uniref:STAS domain-containing protein n=1 Tax=Cryptosporangium phraense TaxID=2593070 RepID=UPI00197AC202|nr:STAS domain-containing protein [Cryptosporangium phraense]